MGDIDSCYREVIMIVCQANQEQELLTVQYVAMTLGVLKTKMVDSVAKLSFRSIAQRVAGLNVQPDISSVDIVTKRSRPTQARTNSTVIWSVVTKGINTKLAIKLVLGKVIKHLTQLFTSGYTHIIKNLTYANTVKGGVIQSGQTYHRNIIENVTTGLTYVSRVTLNLMGKTTKTLEGTNNVIRKRYAKFVSPDNTLPENWEELTPPIERELSDTNA